MNVTFARCEEILNTLPIGYYLGHPVAVKLDPENPATFINLDTETVTVSYKMIAEALESARETVDLEQVIRGLLYHEISHALLTSPDVMKIIACYKTNELLMRANIKTLPTTICDYIDRYMNDIFNIFEDERIETLCQDYYMDVNFKKNVFLLNNVDPRKLAKDPDPMNRFFAAVRFRVAEPEILDEIRGVIMRAKHLDGNSGYIDTFPYLGRVYTLFAKFINNEPEFKSQKPDSSKSSKPEPKSESQESGGLTNDEEQLLAQATQECAGQGASKDMLLNKFKALSTNGNVGPIKNRLERIITAALNKNKNRSSSTHAYAGRIDPRATQSKDYRWFAKKAANTSGRRFDKIHFNLFCDNSGSFSPSQQKMNALLLAIKEYAAQNKDFSVTVIHCGKGLEVKKDNDWALTCGNCSVLKSDARKITDSLQVPNATVVNLVVFDGEMTPDIRSAKEVYKAFDKPNFIVVTDTSNQRYFRFAPSARVTYVTDNYADTFIDVIFNQLARLLG